jgi:hypothetical protein
VTKLAQVGILSAVLAGAWTVPAFTQSANRSGPPSTLMQPKPNRPSGSADQTVQHCRDHARIVTTQMDGLDRAVAEARRSNDPAAIQKALDAAEKASAAARTHVNQCMRMMTSTN